MSRKVIFSMRFHFDCSSGWKWYASSRRIIANGNGTEPSSAMPWNGDA